MPPTASKASPTLRASRCRSERASVTTASPPARAVSRVLPPEQTENTSDPYNKLRSGAFSCLYGGAH